jgi:hypothetical protein
VRTARRRSAIAGMVRPIIRTRTRRFMRHMMDATAYTVITALSDTIQFGH